MNRVLFLFLLTLHTHHYSYPCPCYNPEQQTNKNDSDDTAPFSQTLAIRRRPNIPTCARRALGFATAASKPACCDGESGGKVHQTAGGIGRVGSASALPTEGTCGVDDSARGAVSKVPAATQVDEATAGAAGAGACELSTAEMEIAEAETGGVRAAEKEAAAGAGAGEKLGRDRSWAEVSQGVGWGEEAMPFSSPSLEGVAPDRVAADDDAAGGSAAKRGRRAAGTDDAPMRTGFAREAIIAAAAVETAAKREMVEGGGGEAAGMMWVDPGQEGAGSRSGTPARGGKTSITGKTWSHLQGCRRWPRVSCSAVAGDLVAARYNFSCVT